jgi:hypothetical protein
MAPFLSCLRAAVQASATTGAKPAQTGLEPCVQAIELRKVQNGSYPHSLEELRASLPKDTVVLADDPAISKFRGPPRYFSYQRVRTEHYHLRGVGPDGMPFTADDIRPQIDDDAHGKLRLLLEPPKGP